MTPAELLGGRTDLVGGELLLGDTVAAERQLRSLGVVACGVRHDGAIGLAAWQAEMRQYVGPKRRRKLPIVHQERSARRVFPQRTVADPGENFSAIGLRLQRTFRSIEAEYVVADQPRHHVHAAPPQLRRQ